jgi:hypothetical protein
MQPFLASPYELPIRFIFRFLSQAARSPAVAQASLWFGLMTTPTHFISLFIILVNDYLKDLKLQAVGFYI